MIDVRSEATAIAAQGVSPLRRGNDLIVRFQAWRGLNLPPRD
jgi:hypothetical protein